MIPAILFGVHFLDVALGRMYDWSPSLAFPAQVQIPPHKSIEIAFTRLRNLSAFIVR